MGFLGLLSFSPGSLLCLVLVAAVVVVVVVVVVVNKPVS